MSDQINEESPRVNALQRSMAGLSLPKRFVKMRLLARDLERERNEALRRAETAETLLLAALEKTHCDSHNRQAALCEIRDIIVDHRMAYEGITDEDLFIPHSERP